MEAKLNNLDGDVKSLKGRLNLIVTAAGLIAAIATGGIPWAFAVQSTLAGIQVQVEQLNSREIIPPEVSNVLSRHDAELAELEMRIRHLEKR